MQHKIAKYPVHHPLLKNYIKFFWELRVDHINLNHKVIPQRNINVRFNLSDTPHILSINGTEQVLEDVYFFGLQDHFTSAHLRLSGKVHTLGICFFPDGFYPFIKVPMSEFKNKLFGTYEVGFKLLSSLGDRLKEASDTATRLDILESELLILLINHNDSSHEFRKVFKTLKNEQSMQIAEFCKKNDISIRKLERLYNRHIGISANTYATLNRFHCSVNQLLKQDFSKLSDVAYDYGYCDQMHFIKDFKRFAGNTPKSFVTRNDSILQIGKLI
jgi:AraC-like DNA-binding protein